MESPNKGYQSMQNIPFMIKALLSPNAYPHDVEKVELIETHISWILLTGNYAYKIKKAINLGFFKATKIEEREKFCKEELRLNRRLSPALYIGLSAILGPPHLPRVLEEDDINYINRNSIYDSQIIDYGGEDWA